MTKQGRTFLILCNRSKKPHELGRVTIDPAGITTARMELARRISMVGGTDESHEAVSAPVALDDMDGIRLYCAGCRKLFPTSMTVVRDAMRRGQKVLILQPQGWFNNPLGMLAKKYPRAASD